MNTLKDFFAKGVREVAEMGRGLNATKTGVLVLTAMMSVNAVSATFQPPEAPGDMYAQTMVPAEAAMQAEQQAENTLLSLDNYQSILEAKQNVVVSNPLQEGEVITFVFEKPSDSFIEQNFGADFLKTQTHQYYAEKMEGEDIFKAPVHFFREVAGEKDPNFIVLSGLSDNSLFADASSQSVQGFGQDFVFWHEVFHSNVHHEHAFGERVNDAAYLEMETSADVFSVMMVAKGKLASGEFNNQDVMNMMDFLIQQRTADNFSRDRDQVHGDYLTQPGLFAVKQLYSEGHLDLAGMGVKDLADLSMKITQATQGVDLNHVAEANMANPDYGLKELSAGFFKRTVRSIVEDGPEEGKVPLMASIGRIGGQSEGLIKIAQDLDDKPEFFAQMTPEGIKAYAQELSEMPGGRNFTGQYDLSSPQVNTGLKDMEHLNQFFQDIAQQASQQLIQSGALDQGASLTLGSQPFDHHNNAEREAAIQNFMSEAESRLDEDAPYYNG